MSHSQEALPKQTSQPETQQQALRPQEAPKEQPAQEAKKEETQPQSLQPQPNQEKTDTTDSGDCTLLFDLELVGAGEPVKLKGSITMPGLVHRTGLASATQRMERTIGDNIASPLVMRFSDTVASLFMASRTPLPMGASDSRMLTDGMTHGDE